MEETFIIKKENRVEAFRTLLKNILATGTASAVLVPLRSDTTGAIMPALVADPGELDRADPLSPAFGLNSARLVSRLTKRTPDQPLAAVLRPCETRAWVELVKIRQAGTDNLLVIAMDCCGAFPNEVFNTSSPEPGDVFTNTFIETRLESGLTDTLDDRLSKACRICESPYPEQADIHVHLFNTPIDTIHVKAGTPAGKAALSALGLEPSSMMPERETLIQDMDQNREKLRKEVFQALEEKTGTLTGLSAYLAHCVNCYNCRVACPICFCRECVFNTDVFDYEPFQYTGWAKASGAYRMPGDTVFFHLTRMVHMALSCVGCGQCSNACPNGINLAELFMAVSQKARKGFEYVPGRSLDEAPPLSIFLENEYQETTWLDQ